MSQYITTTEFKAWYPQANVSAYTDATLDTLLQKASARVDGYVGYVMDDADVTDEVSPCTIDEYGNIVIFPRRQPLNSVSSVTIVKGTTSISITLTNNGSNVYTIPATKDRLIIPYEYASLNVTTVGTFTTLDYVALASTDFYSKISYNGGYSTIPDEVKDATALYMLDTLSRSMNLSGARRVSEGGISIDYGSGSQRNSDGKTDFVLDAENLLSGYRKASGF